MLAAPRDRAQHVELTLRLVQETLAFAVVDRVDLTGQHQHRRRRELCFEQSRNGVGGTGTGARDRNTEPTRRARVAVGRMHTRLLVTNVDRRDAAATQDRVVHRYVVHADDAEHVSYIECTQARYTRSPPVVA